MTKTVPWLMLGAGPAFRVFAGKELNMHYISSLKNYFYIKREEG